MVSVAAATATVLSSPWHVDFTPNQDNIFWVDAGVVNSFISMLAKQLGSGCKSLQWGRRNYQS